MLWLKERGYDLLHKSLFDYSDFTKNGGEYLIREFGEDIDSWQIKHSNIPLEQQRSAHLIESGVWHLEEPSIEDITQHLADGYLVRCLINSAKLNNREGYVGHSIIISDFDDDGFTIQDPGLPPIENRKVKYADFEAAWACPNKEAKELDAIRKINS